MGRPTPPPDTTLSEQAALNAIVRGVSFARSTDTFVSDVKGSTLALSVTNASKAVPGDGVRAIAFWCDVDFRYRLNAAADLTDGAYAKANDVVHIAIDPNDTQPISTIQAILASSTGTLTINFVYGT